LPTKTKEVMILDVKSDGNGSFEQDAINVTADDAIKWDIFID